MILDKINLIIVIAYLFFGNINCENHKYFEKRDVSIDSLSILKNKYFENISLVDSSLHSYLGDSGLWFLLSCRLSNHRNDTLVVYTDHLYNLICVNRVLEVKNNTVRYNTVRTIEFFEPRYDTIYPGLSKMYYIPIFGFPELGNSSHLYISVQNVGKYLNEKTKSEEKNNRDEVGPIGYFTLYIDLIKNETKVVNEPIENILQKHNNPKYNFK